MTKEKPAFVTEAHLIYLDELRESGDTNMYVAHPYLLEEFPSLTEDEASKIVSYWRSSFSERHGG